MKLALYLLAAASFAVAAPVLAQSSGDGPALLKARVQAFKQCADVAIPRLDDRFSDPDRVATAVQAACSAEFEAIHREPGTVTRAEWVQILQPHLIKSILDARSLPAKPAAPARPRPTS